MHLPPNSKSFEQKPGSIQNEDALYIPLIAICGMRFCTAITLMVTLSREIESRLTQKLKFINFRFEFQVQFSMFGELYSFKARSLGTSATIGTNNILVFIAVKIFYDLENVFDLPTTMGIYFVIGTLG